MPGRREVVLRGEQTRVSRGHQAPWETECPCSPPVLTCRVVDRGARGVHGVLGSGARRRIHGHGGEARLGRRRAGFGVHRDGSWRSCRGVAGQGDFRACRRDWGGLRHPATGTRTVPKGGSGPQGGGHWGVIHSQVTNFPPASLQVPPPHHLTAPQPLHSVLQDLSCCPIPVLYPSSYTSIPAVHPPTLSIPPCIPTAPLLLASPTTHPHPTPTGLFCSLSYLQLLPCTPTPLHISSPAQTPSPCTYWNLQAPIPATSPLPPPGPP